MNPEDIRKLVQMYPFLGDVSKISTAEEERLRGVCSSWNVIGQHLQSLTLDELEKAMVLELHGKSRLGILNRLNTRRQKLRAQLESKMLSKGALSERASDN